MNKIPSMCQNKKNKKITRIKNHLSEVFCIEKNYFLVLACALMQYTAETKIIKMKETH